MTTTKNELEIFLEDLSVFFPIASTRDKDRVIESYAEYLLQVCEFKNYKFSVIKKWIINNYTKSGFPEVTFIRDALKQGEIVNIQTSSDDGKLAVVTLPNGQVYSFVITANAIRSISDIKEDVKRKYDTYPDVKIYPKGTVLIGNDVFEYEEEQGEQCS